MHSGQRWPGLKGIVQPDIQVPVEEQLLTEQRGQIGQRPGELRFQLQVLQHQHGDQRRPDLRPNRVGAGPHKCLDFQRLLQRLEE